MHRRILIAVVGICTSTICFGTTATTGVPFELDAHRVFIPVSVNDSNPLRLFLDTGLTYPGIFLFHEEMIDSLDLPERIPVLVPGAGDGEPTRAVMADSMELRIGDSVLSMQKVVISQGEGTQTFASDGIIGGSLFTDFLVELDYGAMQLHLHDPGAFEADTSWTALPITLKRGIPWLTVDLGLDGEPLQSFRVYVDLADDFPLTLLTGTGRRIAAPEDLPVVYLGTGLSGDIHGKIGRVALVKLGPHRIEALKTAYAPATTRSKQIGADGILGNGLFERFHVVFDYAGKQILVKPNSD